MATPIDLPFPRRAVPRREIHRYSTGHAVRNVIIVLLALMTLAAVGSKAIDHYLQNRQVTAMMGPKARLAPLPAMEFALGGPRSVEVEVSLVLAPNVKASSVLKYQDRIADRLFQTVGSAGADRLTAKGSAEFLKQQIREAVREEAGSGMVRDVYIQRMVVK